MTKYNIRVYLNGTTYPSLFEGVDRYLMQSGNWLVMKWDDLGTTTLLNIDTAQQIIVDEVEADHE